MQGFGIRILPTNKNSEDWEGPLSFASNIIGNKVGPMLREIQNTIIMTIVY